MTTITFDTLFQSPQKEQTMDKKASADLTSVFWSSMNQSVGQDIQKQAAATERTQEDLGKEAAHKINAELDDMVKRAAADYVNEEYLKYAQADYYGRMYAHGIWNGVNKAAQLDGVQMPRDKKETRQGGAADTNTTVDAPPATMGEGIAYLAAHIAKKPVGQVSAPSETDGPNKIVQISGDGFNA